VISAWRCAVCGTTVDIVTPFAWRCPRASPDDRHHVLHPVVEPDDLGTVPDAHLDSNDPNPYVRFSKRLAWWAFAQSNGLDVHTCLRLTREVADGFEVTPYAVSPVISDELGVEVWVKDETVGVAGSHKARHLVTIMLHLRAAEELGMLAERPPLAIASCGNAALAASTLAWRAGWPIQVFVPEWMDDAFGARLDELGAEVHRCPRRDGDAPGDPAVHRFREAVTAGAIPFSVQGPENAYCLDGGRTLGWEMAAVASPARLFVQVGGGAFASCAGAALGPSVRLHAVQAEGCAPLARAWQRSEGVEHPATRWAEIMTPWDSPASLADGILDDETYDWVGVILAMRASGGSPVVATEQHIVAANDLAHRAGFAASHTGSAGLAGLLAVRDHLEPSSSVAVVMSGVARPPV
jgi:threonine synthase